MVISLFDDEIKNDDFRLFFDIYILPSSPK